MENTICPICDVDDCEFFYGEERNDSEVNFVICKKCGLVYQNLRMSAPEFDKYYKSSFRTELFGDDLDKYINERVSVGDSILELFDRVPEFVTAKRRLGVYNMKVLDIGCGVGGVMKAFSNNGYLVNGIDIGSYLTKIGREKLGMKIKDSTLFDYVSDRLFNLVILCHSLEHLTDPLASLKKISDLMAEDSFVYVELPDIERPYSWTSLKYFFMLGHVYYYSPVTLNILFNKCGLERCFVENNDSAFLRAVFKKRRPASFDYNLEDGYSNELIAKFNEIKKIKNGQ